MSGSEARLLPAEDVGADWGDFYEPRPAGVVFECSSVAKGQTEGVQVYADHVVLHGPTEPGGRSEIAVDDVDRWWTAPVAALVLLGIDATETHRTHLPTSFEGPLHVALTGVLGDAVPVPA